MKTFVIGATGQLGSVTAARMKAAGGDVTGLARSGSAAAALEAAGIRPFHGTLDRLDQVVAEACRADVTIFAPQLDMDAEHMVVATLLDALGETGKTLIFTSGTGVLAKRTGGGWDEDSYAEDDVFPVSRLLARRVETERLVRRSIPGGVRGIVVRPSAVWGHGYHSIAERLVASHARTGAVCYIGEGLNCYSSVHVDDLADLYLAAAERGTAGALYHAVSGEVNNRCIAELLASRIGCATRSVDLDEAIEIWGKFSALVVLSTSSRTRCPRARTELRWTPTRTDVVGAILDPELRTG